MSANASTLSPNVIESCRVLNFTSNAYWEFADIDDLSFGNGSTDSPFSIVVCINPNDINTNTIGKMDSTAGNTKKEYLLNFSSNLWYWRLYDNVNGGQIGQAYASSMAGDIGSYHTYISTYSGSKTSAGCKLYRDGVNLSTSSQASGSDTAMSNTTSKIANYVINSGGAKAGYGNYKASFMAIIAEELSAAQVKDIHNLRPLHN